jgi:hypothetical protein
MSEERITAVVQRDLDELAGDSPAEPIVRAMLDRAVRRLHLLCAALLCRSYARKAWTRRIRPDRSPDPIPGISCVRYFFNPVARPVSLTTKSAKRMNGAVRRFGPPGVLPSRAFRGFRGSSTRPSDPDRFAFVVPQPTRSPGPDFTPLLRAFFVF